MDSNYTSSENNINEFQLKNEIEKYVVHWPWFLLGIFLSLSVAFVYLRYTTPQYQATTTILVKDEKKGGLQSELSAFADMGLGKGLTSNVDNEIEIIKSRSLVESTVKMMKLNVSYYSKGKLISTEIYKSVPIELYFINTKSEFTASGMLLEFTALSVNSFKLQSDVADQFPLILSNKETFRYGEIIPTRNGDIIITKSIYLKNKIKNAYKSISIVVRPMENVVNSYLSRLKVNSISKTSSVVAVSITDPVIGKAEDFLDNLIQIYNTDASEDKNYISENTSKFIANRLELITSELGGVEQDVEQFKRSNNVTDIESEAKIFIEGSSEFDKKSVEVDIQLNVVSSMLAFLKKSSAADLLPSSILSGQADASALINSYNQIVLERNRILQSATSVNPTVVKLEQQLASLKTNVFESLERVKSNLTIQKRDLRNQVGLLDSKIEKIPVQERQYRVIARQQKVKEELYLYLLKKREETAISMAATSPSARVIDTAKALKNPVAPKKNIIYLAALLLGILIPFGIFYILDLLDTKVRSRLDITNRLNIPFLGDIPKSMSPNEIIDTSSRSGTAEALRIVKTNLDFMLNKVPEGQAKTIFLTSTLPGEGKTFLSVNLAGVFALSGKKVLLIGMDIRNPKLNDYFDLSGSKGLTNYLSSNNVQIADYIFKSKLYEEFYILPPGTIPPNPTELLMNKKVTEIFSQFKKDYDYIIVDTAPVSLVSDTLIVAHHADTFVYIVRANYLDKRMLYIPDTMKKENKLPNIAILLNDTQTSKGYGYGYGYGYGVLDEKIPWYKNIFK